MSGTLYVVATPIGNLEDITLRALRILREVAVIAAEDTRRTAKLLAHHGIPTRAVSFHEHNARTRLPQLMGRLEGGESVAIVSDAGTPGVSDPGLELVQACIARGVPIDPIPGASAPLTALVASGFPLIPSTFYGFPPPKANARTRWISDVCAVCHTVILFESPHRIASLLAEAGPLLGTRPLLVARELTKVHQEFLRGTAGDLAKRLNEARGEFTVVIGPKDQVVSAQLDMPDANRVASDFRQLTEIAGLARRAAVTELARRYGRSAREVYARIEDAKARLS